MHRQFPALLALLVAVAAVGVAPADTAAGERPALQPVVDDPNTTSRLELDGPIERTGFSTADIDVAGALAADTAAIHSQYERHRLDRRYRSAPNETARREVLQNASARLDTRISNLSARERATLRAYNDGDITTETYLRRVAVLATETKHLQSAVSRLHLRVEAADGEPVATERIASFKTRLAPYRGPVRGRVASAADASADPVRVYVETSSDGTVMAMVDDGDGPARSRYVRVAHATGARDPDATDQFGEQPQPLEAAVDRAEELYPWAFEHHQGYTIGLFGEEPYLYRAGVYAVGVNHPHGVDRQFDLVTYLDGGTTDVFYEVQYKSPDRVPTDVLGNNSTDRLGLTVRSTGPGGAAKANVTNATGVPVDAVVYVDGTQIGRTGADGERWFVAPRGSVNVTAVADGDRVATTVETA